MRWLSDLVNHLMIGRGIPIAALMRCKFILARKIYDKISAIRRQERKSAYQQRLFAPEAKVAISFDNAFSFKAGMYQDQRRYRGRWKPGKHFLGPDYVRSGFRWRRRRRGIPVRGCYRPLARREVLAP